MAGSLVAFPSPEPRPPRPARPVLEARRLIVLREVARHGSFSAAAHALFITQPAVSRQIATLERELGRKVLVRTPRGLSLTEAGRVLVEHAEGIIARLAAAEGQLASLDRLESGRLRLGASGSAAARVLVEALRPLKERYPGLDLSLQDLGGEDAVAPIREGELDLALAFESPLAPPPIDPEVERHPLRDDPLCLVLPADHALADSERLDLAALAGEAWVRVLPEGPGVAYAACVAAGFEPRIRYDARGARVALDLVGAGLGVAFVSTLALDGEPGPGVVVRSLGEAAPVRVLVAATRPADSCPPAATALLAELRATV